MQPIELVAWAFWSGVGLLIVSLPTTLFVALMRLSWHVAPKKYGEPDA